MPETSISAKPTPGIRARRRSMATWPTCRLFLIHVGEDEILLDDARRYADLVAKSGSAAELHVWQGTMPVFPANLGLLHAAREALDYRRRLPSRKLTR
jgi:acetyl esterase/lipase